MITDDEIADMLFEVDEEDVEKELCDLEVFHTSLSKAIVAVACFNGDAKSLTVALDDCMKAVKEIQAKKAQVIAQDKYDAVRFSAESKDDDFYLRMTA